MKQSEAQRIGERGETLFKLLHPDGWIPQKLSPDYGEDHRARVVQGNDVLLEAFTVQVKTVQSAKWVRKEVRLQLEQKDLKFRSDQAYQDALFMVVVELNTGKGYWLFMRQYLEETPKGLKKKPTVYVPLANDLSNKAKFVPVVADAIRYTTRATSIPAAQQIAEHFAELRRLDERF